MKAIVSVSSKGKMNVKSFFKTGLILFFVLFLAISAFGKEIKTIQIVTPEWPGQTNKDGTGLFFDIVRSVYEPAGIKMEYRIVPWKRGEKMLASKKADAMLDVLSYKEINRGKYPMNVLFMGVAFKKGKVANWHGPKTIANKKVVWLRGYNHHNHPNLKGIKLNWREVDLRKEAWGLLNKGRVDFYIESLLDMEGDMKKGYKRIDMNSFQIEIIWSENTYMGFSKSEKSKKLIEIYDKRIIEVFKSGELEKLFKKWGSRFSPDPWEQ